MSHTQISGLASASLTAEKISAQIMADLDAAWNERKASTLAWLFQEQGDIRDPSGDIVAGRVEIEKQYAQILPELPPARRHTSRIHHARWLSETMIIADGEAEIADLVEPDGRMKWVARLLGTVVLIKQEDQWYLSALRVSIPPA